MTRAFRQPVAFLLACLLAAPPATYAQTDLPDFGSPQDSVLTKEREKMLGRSVILQLRQADMIVDDPQLNEYIGLLGSKLASQANDGDFDFDFFVIDDDAINAFAMPGGVIGVNSGLLLATDDENELAGVIAHEVSHVTQRHLARSAYDRQRTSILSMAGVLAAVLIGASGQGSGDAAVGAAAAAQAAAAQHQINFTRANESEADRVGMGVLSRAGFDPVGMASFFEKLSRLENRSLSQQSLPEMLRSHPTSTTRIAEARQRARQLPRTEHADSTAYGLAKARMRVLSAESPKEAVAYFRARSDSTDPADRYGLALSLSGIGDYDNAERMFRDLSEQDPSVMAYRIGRAEALMAAGLDDQALAVYREANAVAPRNIPLVISYGQALIVTGKPAEAHALLLDLLNNVDPTPAQIELLARAANAEGDDINAHHYMSEYYASIGNIELAITQLEQALDLPGLNSVQRARFNARIAEFQDWLDEAQRRG